MPSTDKSLISLPCMRGEQSAPFFTCVIPVKQALSLLKITDPDLPVPEKAQRNPDPKRIEEMSEYIIQRQYILPGITAEIKGEYKFNPIGDSEVHGLLEFEIGAEILITDGQHRIEALRMVLRSQKFIENHSISVQIYPWKDLQTSQERFSAINRYAKQPPQSISIAYDHTDMTSRLMRSLTTKLKTLPKYIEREKNTPSAKSNNLFSIKQFYITNKIIHEQFLGLPQPPDFIKIVSKVKTYWELIAKYNSYWVQVFNNDKTVNDIRKSTIACHQIFLDSLGYLFIDLAIESSLYKEKDYKEKLTNILQKLESINLQKSNEEIQEVCFQDGKIKKNKTTTIALKNYIKGHLENE